MASQMCARKYSYNHSKVAARGSLQSKDRLEELSSPSSRRSDNLKYSWRERNDRNHFGRGTQDASFNRNEALSGSESKLSRERRDRHHEMESPRSSKGRNSPSDKTRPSHLANANTDGNSLRQKATETRNRRSLSGPTFTYAVGKSARHVSRSSSTGLESPVRRHSGRDFSSATTTNDANDDFPCSLKRDLYRDRFLRPALRNGSSRSISLHSSYSSHSTHYSGTPLRSRKRSGRYDVRSSATPPKKKLLKDALRTSTSDEDKSDRFTPQASQRRVLSRTEEIRKHTITTKKCLPEFVQEDFSPTHKSSLRNQKALESKRTTAADVPECPSHPSLESFLGLQIQHQIKQEVGKRVEAYLQSSKFQNEVENRIATALRNLEQHIQERLETETKRIVETFHRVETQKRLQNQRTEEILAENDRRIREEQKRLAQEKVERDEQRLKELERICEHKRMEKHKRMEPTAGSNATSEPHAASTAMAQQRRLSTATGPRLIAFRVGSGKTSQNIKEPLEP